MNTPSPDVAPEDIGSEETVSEETGSEEATSEEITPNTPAGSAVDEEPGIRVVPSLIRALGIVGVGVGITGDYDMNWGDGASDPGGGESPLGHTYSAAGRYALVIRQGDNIVVQSSALVRDTMHPNVKFAPTEDSNIIEATFNDDPADIVSQYRIVWQEPDQEETLWAPKGTTRRHRFSAGTHTIRVYDLLTGRTLVQDVQVKDPEYDPDFTIAQGADDQTVVVTVTRALASPAKDVLIDWDDAGAQITLPAAKVGDTATHKYASAGVFIIQAAYTDGSTEGSAHTAVLPFTANNE